MLLNRIRNESLLQHIDTDIIGKKLQRPAAGSFTAKIGSPAVLLVSSGKASFQAATDEPVQAAQSRPMDKERICSQLRKTGNSEFHFRELTVEMDENIFIPVQQLNLLRRSALEGLKEKLLSGYLRKSESPLSESGSETSRSGSESRVPSLSIYAESVDQLSAAASCITELHTFPARIYLGTDIQSELMNENGKEQISKILSLFRKNKAEIVIAMPHILRSTEREVTETLLNASDALSPDGILIRNCEELQLLKERGFDKKIILDHNLYVFNPVCEEILA